MNVDEILNALNAETVDFLLIGGISDQDMLACQEALPPDERKQRRMEVLRAALSSRKGNPA